MKAPVSNANDDDESRELLDLNLQRRGVRTVMFSRVPYTYENTAQPHADSYRFTTRRFRPNKLPRAVYEPPVGILTDCTIIFSVKAHIFERLY